MYPKSWIEHWLDDLTLDSDKFSKQHVLVAEKKSEIIGFCSIIDNIENYEILHLWLLPKHIGKGIGKKLLIKTIDRFVKLVKPITVVVDPNAEKFYKCQGFVTYERVESFPEGRFLPKMKTI